MARDQLSFGRLKAQSVIDWATDELVWSKTLAMTGALPVNDPMGGYMGDVSFIPEAGAFHLIQ